ncbi:hypothetical protein [Nocardia bovistercoris]|uniref:hypothetical protein n=1 Tax=Nocardia bovistercoris TaxID=2785916 RepID=UPI001E5F9AD8|nr:hypothetical protein [Nocardia bovistercoris]
MNSTKRALAIGLGAALLQALMLIAFAWPAANIAPRDLPLAVAGPQAGAVETRLHQTAPGAFEITTVADEAAARAAIADREVYGAIVTGAGAPRMLVASGASPAVAQQLAAMAQTLSGVPPAAVEDVVAADSDDPRGTAFGAMVLPLVMSGIAAGVLLSLVIPTAAARGAGLLSFGVAGGLLSTAIIQGWMSVVPGPYLLLSAVAGLVSAAVAGAVVGLAAVVGRAGIGIAALTMLLVGNPFSAATSAPELLPQPWGAIGQYLPPGAAASLLRSVAFFDGTGAAKPLAVLGVWVAVAAVLLIVGVLRERAAGQDRAAVLTGTGTGQDWASAPACAESDRTSVPTGAESDGAPTLTGAESDGARILTGAESDGTPILTSAESDRTAVPMDARSNRKSASAGDTPTGLRSVRATR